MPEGKALTATEAKALLELVSSQKDSDKAIATRLGMAPSNFAVVKRRLQDKGVLLEHIRMNPHRIPDIKVAAFVWIEYNKPIRKAFAANLTKIRETYPHAYTHGSLDWSLNVSYYSSFEASESARLRMAEKLFTSEVFRPLISSHVWKTVPIAHLARCDFMGRFVAQAVGHEKHFDHKVLFANCQYPVAPEQVARLNDTEKRVLIALRKHPQLKKSEIAAKVGIQQSTLSEIFKTLQRKGVISHVRTIDPKMLPGSEIATITWVEMKRPIVEDMEESVGQLAMKIPQLYRIYYTRTFMLVESLFSSLDKAESAHLALLGILGDNVKALNFKIVPCAHLSTEYHSYFLEQLFEQKG